MNAGRAGFPSTRRTLVEDFPMTLDGRTRQNAQWHSLHFVNPDLGGVPAFSPCPAPPEFRPLPAQEHRLCASRYPPRDCAQASVGENPPACGNDRRVFLVNADDAT